MSDYPEHEKMRLIKDQSQSIGEFLEWLQDKKEVIFAEYPETNSDHLFPLHLPTQKLIAEFFDIDLDKIEDEKDAMLEEQRRLNNQT
jgi:hypothetical protein